MLGRGIADPRVAVSAVLATDTSSEVTDTLLGMLQNDNSKWVRLQALRSLCSPGRRVAKDKVVRATEAESDADVLALRWELLAV
jgi:hypothetical protein